MTKFLLVLLLAASASVWLAFLVTWALYAASRAASRPAPERSAPQRDVMSRMEGFLAETSRDDITDTDLISRLRRLLPSWFEAVAAQQGRPVRDVIRDTMRLSLTNVSGLHELANEEVRYPGLRQVWVFARRPADLEESFYSTVKKNIVERFVSYYYFLPEESFFLELRRRLIHDTDDEEHIDLHLHLLVLPRITFMASTGRGLFITDDVASIRGKTVIELTDDGRIREAQDMTRSEVKTVYTELRAEIEKHYRGVSLPRFLDEPPTEGVPYPEIYKVQ